MDYTGGSRTCGIGFAEIFSVHKDEVGCLAAEPAGWGKDALIQTASLHLWGELCLFPITTGFLFVLWWAGVVPVGCGKGQALIPLKIAPLVTDQRGIPGLWESIPVLLHWLVNNRAGSM